MQNFQPFSSKPPPRIFMEQANNKKRERGEEDKQKKKKKAKVKGGAIQRECQEEVEIFPKKGNRDVLKKLCRQRRRSNGVTRIV